MPYYICNPTNKVNLINCKPGTVVVNSEIKEFHGGSWCSFWKSTNIQKCTPRELCQLIES
jgi:hypothetical protein